MLRRVALLSLLYRAREAGQCVILTTTLNTTCHRERKLVAWPLHYAHTRTHTHTHTHTYIQSHKLTNTYTQFYKHTTSVQVPHIRRSTSSMMMPGKAMPELQRNRRSSVVEKVPWRTNWALCLPRTVMLWLPITAVPYRLYITAQKYRFLPCGVTARTKKYLFILGVRD